MSDNGMMTIQVPTRITDPATLRLLAEQLVAVAENTVDPQPQEMPLDIVPEPEPQRAWKPPVRTPHAGVCVRAWTWLIVQASTPLRFKRFVLWWLRLPSRAWSMVMVLSSRKIDAETEARRDNVCHDCPFRHYRMRRTRQGIVMDEHCGKCSCPDTRLSRNEYRNAYSGWKCPERKHAGPYPDDDLREHLEANGYDPKIISGGGGGCTGCGCGKAKQ